MLRRHLYSILIAAAVILSAFVPPAAAGRKVNPPSPAEVKRVTEAMPTQVPARPARPRRVLVFWRCEGFFHSCIPLGNKCFEIMGAKTGAFQTVVSDDMAMLTAGKLSRFDAVLLNNSTSLKPNAEQRKALTDFVKGGKGLVGIHAATDNFYDWPEGAAMVGGLFAGHPWGAEGTWAVKLDEPGHVLNNAFGGAAFSIKDEIYQIKKPYSRDKLRVLLSLDMTNPVNQRGGRPDKDNAIAWIQQVGKGRSFYCSLGHNNSVYWDPAVLRHYLAGIQYALGDLKADATPSAKLAVKPRPALTTGTAAALAQFGKVVRYDYRGSRRAMAFIEGAARTASPQERKLLEGKLIELLASDRATTPCKQWACRMLRRIGTVASVPALARLLPDNDLSHMARFALQDTAGPEAAAALRDAMGKLSGKLRIGVISSLGARRDPKAVGAIAKLAAGSDPVLADAALSALGMIGTDEAARALAEMTVPAALNGRRVDSYLMCADKLAADGKTARAGAIYRSVLDNKRASPLVRVAALRGVVLTKTGNAVDVILKLLDDKHHLMRQAAAKFIIEMPGTSATKAFAAKLPSLPPKAQVLVIGALTTRGDRAAGPAVAKAVGSSDPAVRMAALDSLGAVGSAGEVDLLAVKAVGGSARERDIARGGLLKIRGPGVDAAIGKLLSDSNEQIRLLAASTLGRRGGSGAVDALIETAGRDSSTKVRAQAMAALAKQASAGNVAVGPLVKLLVGATDEAQRSQAERAVVAAAGKIPARQGRAKPVLAALAEAKSVPVKASLINALGGIGDNAALPALRAALADTDGRVKLAAVRAAAAWPTSGTADICLKIADSAAAAKTHRIIALRGYIKQAALQEADTDDDVVAMYDRAIRIAQRSDEKILALSELGKLRHEKALEVAKRCTADPALKDAAAAAVRKITRAMQAPATVSASHNNDRAKFAMDGKAETRWDTGSPMTGGEWFKVDMGHTGSIRKLVLDCQRSSGDYPRGYEVYLSGSRRSRGTLVAKGKGTNWNTVIKFKPTTARYITIVQTGKSEGLFWSIHKLTID